MHEPIHPAHIEALRKMTPEQKLRAVGQFWQLGKEMLAAGIRLRHPDWDDSTVQAEVRRRLIYATFS